MGMFFALRAVTSPQILSNPPPFPQGYTIDVDQLGSLGIAGVRGRYGGILVVEPPKYPHISSLPRRFPKTHQLSEVKCV